VRRVANASSVATLFEYTIYDYEELSSGEQDYFVEEENKLYLTRDTLNELERLNRNKKFLEIGRRKIKPLNYVGVVKTGSITIQVFPKLYRKRSESDYKDVAAKNLLKMLSFTETLQIRDVDYADLVTRKLDFFEIFIYLFAKNLLKILKTKQNIEYVRRKDDLRFVRERIDFRRYSNPARLHIIPCIFHDRSADNTINRTLKYTSYLMSRVVESKENYQLLKSIINILPAKLTPVSLSEIKSITFNRLNKEFKPFIDICRVFLENSTLTLQASEVKTFSMLIPMEKLFEEFIAGVIRKERLFGPDVSINVQKSFGYLATRDDGKREFSLIPDIVVTKNEEKYVIDTKYKLLDAEDRKLGVSQQDLYQMYAYATKLGAEKVLLLYPDLNGELKGDWYFEFKDRDSNTKKIRLFVRTVNLSTDLCSENGWAEFVESLNSALKCLADY
jgi:5-methylcytosine-specific restriction enzyme subunit McrC